MNTPTGILAGLPTGLRDELLKSYREITTNYLERRWEPSELNGGKFSEVVYSIIDGAIKGAYPAHASKPAQMLQACRNLETQPADPNRVGDRSLRILIPRVLPVLYEVRNNRGVGHVGGDVNANHMDAEAVQAMATWVMAELVRIFHGVATEEAQRSVDTLVERKTPAIWEIEGVKRVLIPGLSMKDQVLMLLYRSSSWVPVSDLLKWVEYSNPSLFRSSVLSALHKSRLIEFDTKGGRAQISPRGSKDVEDRLLHAGAQSAKREPPKRKPRKSKKTKSKKAKGKKR